MPRNVGRPDNDIRACPRPSPQGSGVGLVHGRPAFGYGRSFILSDDESGRQWQLIERRLRMESAERLSASSNIVPNSEKEEAEAIAA